MSSFMAFLYGVPLWRSVLLAATERTPPPPPSPCTVPLIRGVERRVRGDGWGCVAHSEPQPRHPLIIPCWKPEPANSML